MTLELIGDRRRFALAYELRTDPDPDGEPARRASWGAMQIWVAGRNLTAGVSGTSEYLHEAECPLLPIVEWLLENWDPITHEERLPYPLGVSSSAEWYTACLFNALKAPTKTDRLLQDREDWWSRHGLGSALPDFRIPDLHLRRSHDDIELSWDDREWRTVPRGVELTEPPGAACVGVGEVAEVLSRWCGAILGALSSDPFTSERVRQLQAILAALGSPERQTQRLCWSSGQMVRRAAIRIRDLAGSEGADLEVIVRRLLGVGTPTAGGLYAVLPVPVLLFRSASPNLSDGDLHSLLSLCDIQPAKEPGAIERFRTPIRCSPTPEETTQQGYELALQFRNTLGIAEHLPLTSENDIEQWLLPRLGVILRDLSLNDFSVDGVSVWQPPSSTLVAVNKRGRFARHPSGRRMTIAHELCHLLHDGGESGVGVVSNSWAPYLLERRANAFAAMLLAPEQAIALVLNRVSDRWTKQDLFRTMRHLGVGLTMLTRHLHNLGWISDGERMAWVDEMINADF